MSVFEGISEYLHEARIERAYDKGYSAGERHMSDLDVKESYQSGYDDATQLDDDALYDE